MDTRVKENSPAGAPGIELPPLSRVGMAPVPDQHVDASEPSESTVRRDSHNFANSWKETIVVSDKAWRRNIVRDFFQPLRKHRGCGERLLDQDRFASGKYRLG